MSSTIRAMLVVVLTASAAHAGVYLPAKYDRWPLPLEPMDLVLQIELRGSGRVQEMKEQAGALEAKKGELTVEEGAHLGGLYILQGQFHKATAWLIGLRNKEPKNYLVNANLAAAYFFQDDFTAAINHQTELLQPDVWPREVPDWPAERLRFQRRAEALFLELMEHRKDKKKKDELDALFPGANFKDRFIPGQRSVKNSAYLPPDALMLMQQLVLWAPHDDLLKWLLAEIYNSEGEILEAQRILKELENKGFSTRLLRNHRQELDEVAKNAKPKVVVKEQSPPSAQQPVEEPKKEQPTENSWLPDWKTLLIGFGAGVIVGAILLLQFRPSRPHGA